MSTFTDAGRTCLECSEPATIYCATCKTNLCDSDLQHCVFFDHTWYEIGEKPSGEVEK